jgi:flavoprotein
VGVSAAPVVVLYGRDGCHLCEEARASIIALRGEPPRFRLREVDIEADPRLHAAYLERIPVVEVGGEIVCELGLEPDAFERALGGDSTTRR